MISMELILELQKYIDSGFKNEEMFSEKFVTVFDGVKIATFSLREYSNFQFSMREDNKVAVMIDFSKSKLEGKIMNNAPRNRL